MPRIIRNLVSSVGLCALMALTALFAQDPKPKAKIDSKPLPGESNPSTTLYLVLRTGPEEIGEEIVRNIEKALKFTKSTYGGTPKIKAVSPTFFEEFAGLIDQAATALDADEASLGVKRLPSRETVYELSIDPVQVLKKLEVAYKDGSKEEYTPGGPGEKTPLTLIVPGKYAFVPKEAQTPRNYTVTLGEFGKKDATKTAPWPESDKYFVVTLNNYIGNKDELFAALRNPGVVASPFDVKRADDLLFAFANLNSTAVGIGEEPLGIDSIGLTAEELKGRNVRRAWSYFPLDEEGAKAAAETFRRDGMRTVELSKEIRKNTVPASNTSFELKATDEPKWFELEMLPPNERTAQVTFYRKVRVESLREMYERYKSLYRLVVWEFDDGTPEAILIESRDPAVGKTYVEKREFVGFSKRAEATLKKAKQ